MRGPSQCSPPSLKGENDGWESGYSAILSFSPEQRDWGEGKEEEEEEDEEEEEKEEGEEEEGKEEDAAIIYII